MSKKILIITDNLPDQVNGVVTTYKNIQEYAIHDGYSIDYIHPGRFSYFDFPFYNEVKIAFPWKMGKKIEKIRPDYIHIATEGPLGLCARVYLSIRGYRYNTAYHTKFPEGLRKLIGVPEFITWPLIRWFHKNSNRVLTTTPSMVEELQKHGFADNVVPWTRGVDRDTFKPYPFEHNGSPLILYYVGRVSKEKNIDAFCELNIENSVKVIVGDGPYKKELQKKYPGVIFLGWKTGNKLALQYNSADVLVFPSKWDTFGIVMIEAMACGTPVAAYPVQGPLDVIDQGVTGVMDEDLQEAVLKAVKLDRNTVFEGSKRWSWEDAWNIFKDSLVQTK